MKRRSQKLIIVMLCVVMWLPVGEITAQTYTPSTLASWERAFANRNRFEVERASIASLVIDTNENIYVADKGNTIIWKITPTKQVIALVRVSIFLDRSMPMAVSMGGNIYVITSRNILHKITPTGEMTTLAGLLDDKGAEVSFTELVSIAAGGGENIYVVGRSEKFLDYRIGSIHKITPTGVVTTLARLKMGQTSHYVVAADNSDNVYIADNDTHSIRKIAPSGKMLTLAGGLRGEMGSKDGVGTAARFYQIESMTVDSTGNLYVRDQFVSNDGVAGKQTVRKVTPSGVVTTILVGVQGGSITVDSKGNLYMANGAEIICWKLKSQQGANDKSVTRTPSDVAIDPVWKIPVSFSLRDEYDELGVAVKNQKRRGACTVFGTLGVMEFHLAKKSEYIQLSEQFAAWAANQVSHRGGNIDGYNAKDVMDGIKQYGITTEEVMPYKEYSVGNPSRAVLADAATRKNVGITYFKELPSDWSQFRPGFTKDEIRAICGAIAEGSPVTATVSWLCGEGASFDPDFIVRLNGNDAGGHVVVLVGYELDTKYRGGGCFIFRQSWGQDYGDHGYARLTFEYVSRHGWDAFAIRFF